MAGARHGIPAGPAAGLGELHLREATVRPAGILPRPGNGMRPRFDGALAGQRVTIGIPWQKLGKVGVPAHLGFWQ